MIQNYSHIQTQFDKVLCYSQNLNQAYTDKIFDAWAVNKEPLVNQFLKGELIYEHPQKITFELQAEAKEQRKSSFVEYVVNITNFYWDDEFITYLSEVVTPEEFFSNCLERDYIMEDEKKLQKGMKVIKSFKYFIEDEKLLTHLQNKASEIIQENKIEGTLCFSVHPLDYLSVSENNFNWRSCHALDGEYRCGNLSYMMDGSTVVCYLKSDKEVQLPRFPADVPWNNKKWRCLLYFDTSRSVIFAGRQYPFTSPTALELIRDIIENDLDDACIRERAEKRWYHDPRRWSAWHNDYVEWFRYSNGYDNDQDGNTNIEQDRYCVINHGVYDIQKIIKDPKRPMHYNDVLRSTCYLKPYYMFVKSYYPNRNLKFRVGADVPCICCGSDMCHESELMICPECVIAYGDYDEENYPECAICGGRHYYDQMAWVGDDRVCENCLPQVAFQCECCGNWHWNEVKRYNEHMQQFVCQYCDDRLNRQHNTATVLAPVEDACQFFYAPPPLSFEDRLQAIEGLSHGSFTVEISADRPDVEVVQSIEAFRDSVDYAAAQLAYQDAGIELADPADTEARVRNDMYSAIVEAVSNRSISIGEI